MNRVFPKSLRQFAVAMTLFLIVSRVGYAEDREGPLAPVEPTITGTGLPGYRTNQFTGTVTYEIPLKVPSGVNGFEPELILRYNPNNTQGSWLGRGWELSLGQITRSHRKKPVEFTDDDTFVLELGDIRDELVKVSGNNYATLYKQRNLKITKSSNSWTLKDGRGITYTFAVEDQADGAPGAWGWLLSQITDSHGNQINIQYQKSDGWQFLYRISYANREILFLRSGTNDNELYPKYFKQGKSWMKYFLSSIEMRTNGVLFKRYNFTYKSISGLKNRLLETVDEIGSDGSTKRIATMTYKGGPISSGSALQFQGKQTSSAPPFSLGDRYVRMGEVNGDGIPDVLFSAGGQTVDYALGTGTGWSSVTRAIVSGGPGVGFDEGHAALADVDGDGISDIVASPPRSGLFYVAFGTGSGWEAYMQSPNLIPYSWELNPNNITLAEINGDGKADILAVFRNPDATTLYVTYALSTGRSGWKPYVQKSYSVPQAQRFDSVSGNWTRIFDINGDGIDDSVCVHFYRAGADGLLYHETAYLLGNGSGFDPTVYPLSFGSNMYTEMYPNTIGVYMAEIFNFGYPVVHVTDLNNDGFLDLVSGMSYTPREYRYVLGEQNGFGSLEKLNVIPDHHFGVPEFIMRDFDNDGIVDLTFGFLPVYTEPYQFRNLSTTYFAPGILQSVKDELGKITTFTLANSYEATQSVLPYRFPLLKKIEETDGYSPDRSFSYNYFNPKYDRTEREFQGFGRVRETDAGSRWIDTYFLQDRPRLGFIDKIERSNGSKVTNVYPNNTSIPYDNLLTSQTTEEAGKTITSSYIYDSYGNVTQEVISANNGDRFTTDRLFSPNTSAWLVSFPYQETVTDVNGSRKEIKFRYDGGLTSPTKGDLTQEIRYLDTANKDITIEYTYDSYGNRTSMKDALNNTTQYRYDMTFNSFPIEIENPLAQIEQRSYWEAGGGFGQIKTLTDLNNVTTQYFYDGFGRIEKVVGPNDQGSTYGSVTYRYNVGTPGNNYIETLETEEYGTAQYHYQKESRDGFGQIVQTLKDGENSQMIHTRNVYDYRGNLIRSSLPGFGSPGPDVVNTYDLFDRISQTVQPGNYTTIFSYSGWNTTITDPNSHPKTIMRDSRNRMTQVVESGPFTTSYQYDVFDNLKRITDHLGNVWTFTYDSLGRKMSENDPDLGSSTFSYDDNGNLIEKTDALSRLISYQYDALNRMTLKDYSTGPGVEYLYFYDEPASSFGIGRRTRMQDPSGETKFDYDNEGRVVKEEVAVTGVGGLFTTQWTYDAMDRTKKIIYPNAKEVEFTYNDQGLVETVPGFLTNADYTALEQQKKLEYLNGRITDYTYKSDDQRLIRIQTGFLMDFNYQYDPVGNITQVRDDAKSWIKNYTYDDLDRLLTGDGETFSYSAIGNITARNGTPQLYEGLQPHALTNDGGNAYTYDLVGNMISGAGRTISYDAENRPIHILRNGMTTEFLYNGDGDRVLKTVQSGTSLEKTVYIDELYEKKL